jgi:CRP-like cAMP-binding protein
MGLPRAFVPTGAAGARRPGRAPKVPGDVLRGVPLFDGVSDRHLRRIAALGTLDEWQAGSTVVRKGEPGNACYIVLSGRAAVVMARGRKGVPLEPGAVFGELALLDDAPRSASVLAETDVELFRLGRAPFAKLLRAEPAVCLALLRTLAARLRAVQSA